MADKKNILAIIGSASRHSANLKLVEKIASLIETECTVTIFEDLKTLPHFDPELSAEDPPEAIIDFRNAIEKADGILICTPEYVFSIPSGLKNAIEWCIATTVFTEKPIGLITASANGQIGHESLQLIMRTTMAIFNDDTTLLIPGIKGKIDPQGNISDPETFKQVQHFVQAFVHLVKAANFQAKNG